MSEKSEKGERTGNHITGLEIAGLVIVLHFLAIAYLTIYVTQLNRDITELKTMNKSMDTWIVRDTAEKQDLKRALDNIKTDKRLLEDELKNCHTITNQYMRVNSTLQEDILPAIKAGCRGVK